MTAASVREREAMPSKGEGVARLLPPSGSPVASAVAVPAVSDAIGERQALIAVAAYYIAERRGFEPGYELQDWLCAEREVCGK